MANKNEVAGSSPKSVAIPDDIDLLDDAGSGGETIDKDDLAIPRINILQALSPQCLIKTDTFIEGCEPGKFWNTVEEIAIDGEIGMFVIFVSYRRTYLEWRIRESGGGFIADHGNTPELINKCEKDEKNRMINADGHEIKQTAEYYVLIIDDDGTAKPAVISMVSTQLKKSRQLNTKLTQLQIDRPDKQGKFNPAFFYSVFKCTTVPEKNDAGNWMGWKIESYKPTLELENGAEIYKAAKAFREQIAAGTIKVDSQDYQWCTMQPK